MTERETKVTAIRIIHAAIKNKCVTALLMTLLTIAPSAIVKAGEIMINELVKKGD